MSMARIEPNTTTAVGHRARPTITERDIALIERQAAILAKSSIVPLNNPADIAMIGMRALSLGVDPMAAFDDFFPIPSGGKTRLTISARMRVALARRAGCEVWFSETTDTQATCCLRRPRERRTHTYTYTYTQARTAGLAGKDNWKNHTAAMLRAAAARNLVNMAAQDVLLGIGGMGDIDLDAEVADLDIPDDIIDHSDTAGELAAAEVVEMADPAEVRTLLDDIAELTGDQRDWLKGRLTAARLVVKDGRLQTAQVDQVDALIRAAAEVGRCAADDSDGDPFEDVPGEEAQQ